MPGKKIPMPVTLNDCYLLHQIGYAVQINDGRVTVIKENKKGGLKPRYTSSIVSLIQRSVKEETK